MSAAEPKPGGAVCVICGKPQDPQFKPFCSKRCAQLDLSRWLKGGYAIPAGDEDEGRSTPAADPGEEA